MKLLELKLKNFKGVKGMELKANGENLKIYGDNATGKTTIFDAFTYLLFDTDSKNKTEFGIKTWDRDGNVLHHLDHEVEGKFSVDGEIIELKKVYREKWVKRRGAIDRTFDGHETDHFVDGVPVTKTEYNNKIAEIAPEKQFRLLTSPTYFNEQLHWEERRQILLEVCGDVTDEDVIKSNDKLTDLPAILGKRSLEEQRRVIASRRAEINKELDRLPIRIDEVRRGLPDISAIKNPDVIEKELKVLSNKKMVKESLLADLLNGGNTGEIRKNIAELEAQMLTIETEYKREFAKKVGEIDANLKGCQANVQDTRRAISVRKVDLEHGQKLIKTLEDDIVALRDKWHEINGQQLELCVDESCPTCGQDLPAERVQEARDKAVADFNAAKAQKLADINANGKARRGELEKAQSSIKDLEKEIAELEANLDLLTEDNASLQADLAKVKATFEDYKEQDDYRKFVTEKDKLQKQLDGEQVDVTDDKERIEAEIKTLDEAADAIRKAKANLETHEKGQKRIAELELEQKKLSAEFETLEEQLYLIEEFIRTKVNLLTDKINSKFKIARFKLFEEQVNGAIKEVCETTLKGVPWSDLNTGGAINIGLDTINTLAEHYGFTPPVFIDNAEAVTELIPVKGQLISLIVSKKDKSLRIEGPEHHAEQATLFEEAI